MKIKGYITINDIVKDTGLTRQAVYHWIKRGWLPAKKISPKLWLIKTEDYFDNVPAYKRKGKI